MWTCLLPISNWIHWDADVNDVNSDDWLTRMVDWDAILKTDLSEPTLTDIKKNTVVNNINFNDLPIDMVDWSTILKFIQFKLAIYRAWQFRVWFPVLEYFLRKFYMISKLVKVLRQLHSVRGWQLLNSLPQQEVAPV